MLQTAAAVETRTETLAQKSTATFAKENRPRLREWFGNLDLWLNDSLWCPERIQLSGISCRLPWRWEKAQDALWNMEVPPLSARVLIEFAEIRQGTAYLCDAPPIKNPLNWRVSGPSSSMWIPHHFGRFLADETYFVYTTLTTAMRSVAISLNSTLHMYDVCISTFKKYHWGVF